MHDTGLELPWLWLALASMLATARLLGSLSARFRQPAVAGEVLAGVLLGPTCFGAIAPSAYAVLFPEHGPNAAALDGVVELALLLFLLVAGIEVDLSRVLRQRRLTFAVSLAGMVVPFAIGVGFAWLAPEALGWERRSSLALFVLFMGTALAISALPVIAKTLTDLGLFRTDLGMVVIAAAMLDDLTGWLLFAGILGVLNQSESVGRSIGWTIALVPAFAIGLLSVGRVGIDRVLARMTPGRGASGPLGLAVALALIAGALTQWAGVHSMFGAFMMGVALGDSAHLSESARETLRQFVSFVFAPLFFASIGLHLDFARHFDLTLVLVITSIATLGKLAGCGLAARLGGMPWRESWAVGAAMNARGAMGTVLALLAFRAELISERLFVALIVMAIATSLLSGPLIQRLLARPRPRRVLAHLGPGAVICLHARDPAGAIGELVAALGSDSPLDRAAVAGAVIRRETMMTTALGRGLAAPHARLADLAEPLVCVGFSSEGIDFDSPDGLPARLVFLILTPDHDNGAQIDLLADVARSFADPPMLSGVLESAIPDELRAWLTQRSGSTSALGS